MYCGSSACKIRIENGTMDPKKERVVFKGTFSRSHLTVHAYMYFTTTTTTTTNLLRLVLAFATSLKPLKIKSVKERDNGINKMHLH